MQKRLYSDYFIIKRKPDGTGRVATYYKAKVESLIAGGNREIIYFGQMVADNVEVIIKRKAWDEAAHRDDVHTVENLILSAFSRNVCYMMSGLSKWYQLFRERHFSIVMYKVSLSKWDY